MRYKCIVAYDGSNFHGFQVQGSLRTVQREIEDVLKVITKKKTIIYASGRTDTKVHAMGQVFHFDYDVLMSERNMKNAINSRLPKDIHIVSVEHVSEEFHARFSALKKTYKYVIDIEEENPLYANYRWFYKYPFDYDMLVKSREVFLGEHDFSSFTKNHEIENTVRTIYDIKFERDNNLINIYFTGNGFLHNQVRIIVAMMFECARGKINIERLKEIMEAKNRKLSPKTAPPQGLYLMNVEYYK